MHVNLRSCRVRRNLGIGDLIGMTPFIFLLPKYSMTKGPPIHGAILGKDYLWWAGGLFNGVCTFRPILISKLEYWVL